MPLMILVASLFLLAACGQTSTDKQTLEAHDLSLATRIAGLRATDDVEQERLLVTVEHAQTQVARASTQQLLIVLTLDARGVDTRILPGAATALPTSENSVASGNGGSSSGNNGVNSVPTPPRVAITPASTPTPNLQNRYLSNIVIATDVDSNDCALNVTDTITPDTERVYIVATAREMPEGTSITTRWRRGETEVAVYDLTYDYIEEACIWFFVDQTDFTFTPGSYSVVLDVDGTTATQPIPFTVAGPTATDGA